jgi:hypothetical protein
MRKQCLGLLVLSVLVRPAFGSGLTQSEAVEGEIVQSAQQSQQTITQTSERSMALQQEIEALQSDIAGLEVYQRHLEQLLLSQHAELASLENQRVEITQTKQSIIVLMYQMLDGLDQYIQHDLPLKKVARIKRVASLREMMVRSDIAEAEKFRRILEAYQLELDYVNTLGAYIGPMFLDGQTREAELLYLGHVSLLARSLDHQQYWVWQQQGSTWQPIDAAKNNELDKAYLIAHKQAAADILRLPLSISPRPISPVHP